MFFTQILPIENIRINMICSSKKKALEQISHIISEQIQVKEQICFDNLMARERLGCTSLGQGVAIPHAKLPVGGKPTAVFLQLEEPIDYYTTDKREIDLIFALFFPQDCCEESHTLLSELAQKLLNKNLCKQLRSANTVEEILEIFEQADQDEILIDDEK